MDSLYFSFESRGRRFFSSVYAIRCCALQFILKINIVAVSSDRQPFYSQFVGFFHRLFTRFIERVWAFRRPQSRSSACVVILSLESFWVRYQYLCSNHSYCLPASFPTAYSGVNPSGAVSDVSRLTRAI